MLQFENDTRRNETIHPARCGLRQVDYSLFSHAVSQFTATYTQDPAVALRAQDATVIRRYILVRMPNLLIESRVLSSPNSMEIAGVYIHIPFCRSRCSYCDFATGLHGDALSYRYCQVLA